nr:hypothetical protein [Tanacetum cinerariifolium]
MSNCTRINLVPGKRTEAQPEDEKYTLAGLKDLKGFVRYATEVLHIKSWNNGDYNRLEHMELGGGGVGPGFGGHYARDCPTGNSRRGGVGSACYNYGERGHYARDCPTGNSRRGGVGSACYNYGERGHYARDCPTGNSHRSGGSGCYTYGGVDK